MKRTTITVSYARTQSLGNSSNVKPAITLGAELEEGDNVEVAKAALLAEARAFVEEEIDQALEADGEVAKFSAEPRYRALATSSAWVWQKAAGDRRDRQVKAQPPEHLVIIVPKGARLPRESDTKSWLQGLYPSGGMRLRQAHLVVARHIRERLPEAGAIRLIDCADGDLSRIPPWAFEEPTVPPAPADAPLFGEDPADGEYEPDEEDLDNAV